MSIWTSTLPVADLDDDDDPPYVYEASHILPDEAGERGGLIDCAYLSRFVRYYRDHPCGSVDDEPDGIEPWMRITVAGTGTGDLILHARHVRALRDCLNHWLEQVEDQPTDHDRRMAGLRNDLPDSVHEQLDRLRRERDEAWTEQRGANAEIDHLRHENEAFRRAIRTGEGPDCNDVCLVECLGPCGVTPVEGEQ